MRFPRKVEASIHPAYAPEWHNKGYESGLGNNTHPSKRERKRVTRGFTSIITSIFLSILLPRSKMNHFLPTHSQGPAVWLPFYLLWVCPINLPRLHQKGIVQVSFLLKTQCWGLRPWGFQLFCCISSIASHFGWRLNAERGQGTPQCPLRLPSSSLCLSNAQHSAHPPHPPGSHTFVLSALDAVLTHL